jgi:hypothetical protein
VTYFLEHHGRLLHASKALADGRTPLQMAVRAASPDTVAALVRFAPVHDVKRCWDGVEAGLAAASAAHAGPEYAEHGEHAEHTRAARAVLDILRTKVRLALPLHRATC